MEESLKIIYENGKEKEYSVLATFEYNNKEFVVYTDYELDENKNAKIYSAIYKTEGNIVKLEKVRDVKEINVVEKFIKDLEKNVLNI
ncbi:MAG: DUF1292 domain-containing protein [Clostridia bacterium]|nr:DUF1292 domain-containing protein [Clostridia bacterium]